MNISQILSSLGIMSVIAMIWAIRKDWADTKKENSDLKGKVLQAEVKVEEAKIDEKINNSTDESLLAKANARLRAIRGLGNKPKGE